MMNNIFNTVSFLKLASKPPRQVISDSWDLHESILEPDVNMFSWKRVLDPKIPEYLTDILKMDPEPLECCLNRTNTHHELNNLRIKWDQLTFKDSTAFWQDVSTITHDFLKFSDNETGTLHLRVIDNDACRKFHTDGYPMRLFTTYIGKGSEWLPEDAVNRSALGTLNEKIVKDPRKIQQLGTGHVSIFKGELPHKSNRSKGIVHRSPEISHTGEKRIILRVDI